MGKVVLKESEKRTLALPTGGGQPTVSRSWQDSHPEGSYEKVLLIWFSRSSWRQCAFRRNTLKIENSVGE